jgi:hypothetical protein
MPLMLGCFALLFPRVVLFFVWLFGNGYLERALHSALLLILGFLFLPLTTLAYAYAVHSASVGGSISPLGWGIVALGVLVDLGILGGGHRGFRRRR